MRFSLSFSLYLLALHSILLSAPSVSMDENFSKTNKETAITPSSIQPFTGKITKNRVRVRFKPNFDDLVLREANSGDLFVVVGEDQDFYSILPPTDLKGYVYRTFVLDNVIEGNRVNVRLKPDLESPIIAQLNSGDKVDAIIVPTNNKWVEISLPTTARFYVAKEFIDKIGDATLLSRLEKKKQEGNNLLENVSKLASAEIVKPFREVQFQIVEDNYQKLISNYPEFPLIGQRAENELKHFKENYLTKKLAFLEEQSNITSTATEANKQLIQELDHHKTKLAKLEKEAQNYRPIIKNSDPSFNDLPINMKIWIPIEESNFQAWIEQTGNSSYEDYQEDQINRSFTFSGMIEPYQKLVNNKPGDFLMTNPANRLPFAFLYSTSVNLQDLVGKEVTLRVVSRPNNHFAFPAYLVIGVE